MHYNNAEPSAWIFMALHTIMRMPNIGRRNLDCFEEFSQKLIDGLEQT